MKNIDMVRSMDTQEPIEKKPTYEELEYMMYGEPTERIDSMYGTNLEAVEKALGFKLFRWQKDFMCSGSYDFRRTGKTTAMSLRTLLDGAPNRTITIRRASVEPILSFRSRMEQLKEMKQKLVAAGIPVNRIKVKGWHYQTMEEEL